MTKRSFAVITMVFNENIFLPIWLNHYGSLFGFENLFVIDDGSDDGCCQDARVRNLIRKNRSVLDEIDRAQFISYFHAALLEYFDTVIYTDVDELLVVDPRAAESLRAYLIDSKDDYKTVIGFNVVQRITNERALDFEKPLFEQRRYVEFDPTYCKTLISRIPTYWGPGFHRIRAAPRYDSNVFLFHLRAVDVEIAKHRIRNFNTVRSSDRDLLRGHSFQFRLSESEYVEQWFPTSEESFENAHPDLEFIQDLLSTKPQNLLAVLPSRFSKSIMLNTREIGPRESAGDSALSISELNLTFSQVIKRMLAEGQPRSRNALCPCGSNKKIKHCHGSLASNNQ